MKAYIVKLTFEHGEPTVWRRVFCQLMPHLIAYYETTQYATNLQSEMESCRSFAFSVEDLFTNNNNEKG